MTTFDEDTINQMNKEAEQETFLPYQRPVVEYYQQEEVTVF
jgi:hypothetical protein